jgi:23S rRNA (uracil1939-C5)-methyltransferase
VVAIDHCPILDAELDDRLVDLAEAVTAESPRRLDLAVGDGGAVTCSPLFDDQPRGAVERRVGDFVYRYDARAFFQGHAGLLRDLVAAVCGDWSGEQAFDLYAGVGLFSLPLATRYERVTAVEGDRGSSRFARINARANRLGNVAVETRSIETWIEALPAGADRVVVDPPRSGLPRPVVAGLIERRPRRLTYLSCHAATLARDLRVLDASYRIESLDFFDLFPQTVHLETLVQLVLREG